MSGQARWTRFPRRERPFTAFGQGEAKRSVGHCLSRSGRYLSGPVWARHGCKNEKTDGHAHAHANDDTIPETSAHVRGLSGLKRNRARALAPRERITLSGAIAL
ncbi:hypothetical protein GGQ73_002760 [Rhizobium skierniewicense]|uniref:Uncharacterized protein n=1 Tax=Rhizobium skierniewicense TaxID=984260 RepID=A0A7W6G3T1_9HYPH|nr:hypothetical protein [Rhizobium skierniewicense]MBB3946806.1 hypothetical protein [Rhizobium skierniewicense]